MQGNNRIADSVHTKIREGERHRMSIEGEEEENARRRGEGGY